MKIIKRSVAFIFVFILTVNLLGTVCFAAEGVKENDVFKPVIRFIASSDTHVRDDSDVTAERIGKMLDLGYETAENDPYYKNLDALIVAGDLTHDGTKTEFDKFYSAVSGSLKGDTRFLGVVAKNHDGYDMRRKELRKTYSDLTGNDPDFHVVIGGYHFIGVSASQNDIMHYDPGQLKWLKAQLDEAAADDPNRPVFVVHHEHVLNTVYGSSPYDMWGVPYFTNILRQYPQVVDFSGHSHYPLSDPRSIWQGAFTAIGTGAIYYAEFRVGATRVYHPNDAYDTATCWIVEVDKENRIHLRGMDLNAGAVLCEYILNNPADPSNRDYTPEKRKAASAAPVFPSGAEINVIKEDNKSILKFPAAQSTDGMPVVLYRFYVKNKLGMTVGKDWVLPKYYRAAEENEIEYAIKGVPAGNYTVRVCAETAYGVQSDMLETTVDVDAYLCPRCEKIHTGFLGFFTAVLHRIAFVFSKVI
ncbi:MAG: metallophosphoesterase [Clostridiales bacterium]|nr:metallophosphoesterase [Clostridiales bacterium]